MSDEKECFFIAPIGEEGSDIRERSDTLLEYVVEEAVTDYGYSVKRADQLDEPGSITSQIIEKTVESDLVVADLTGHNPNVFYELAVRHATGKPYIQLIHKNESIPFDIADLRTIKYELGVKEANDAADAIRGVLKLIDNGDTTFDNPISRSAEMRSLRESSDPEDHNLADILQVVSSLERKMDRLERDLGDNRPIHTQGGGLKKEIIRNKNGDKIEIVETEDNIEKISNALQNKDTSIEDMEENLQRLGVDAKIIDS
ncbi:hypothetical protein [Halogeometricum limi]|uniref:Nucleoside 2-deoxyribosyltransferase n=1 Tax=Halogeometricum limi TaxID=555875 RepID=A0A1I6FVY3_9EURY|nr:hypothetical protein [Halogeometricum limi]SFR34080.1 hypothetical protein SAMN04488124_0403 [Halogeometricum limi]